jgi:uncharacterized protein
MTDADDAQLRAAQAVDLAAMTMALQNGANVNARDPSFGRTALMRASMHSSVPMMTALVDAGADVNLQATLGETALITAASARGGETLRLLLARGADPTIADRDKKTALMWMVDAQFHRQQDVTESIKPFIDGGVPVNAKTALMWAVKGFDTFDVRPTVLKALVENGTDVNAADSNGETAMFGLVRFIDNQFAIDNGPDCIQVLTDAGADPNARNNEGKTPLGVVHPGNAPVIELLKGLGFTELPCDVGRVTATSSPARRAASSPPVTTEPREHLHDRPASFSR